MSFSLDISKAVKNINEHTEKVVRGTIIGVSTRIIKRTPVGNPDLWESPAPEGYVGGSLRGAWNASIGTPDHAETGIIERSESGGGTAIEAAKVANALDIGQKFYLTNPLPYAYPVEHGWSSQAPEGMVRLSVIESQQVLDKLK